MRPATRHASEPLPLRFADIPLPALAPRDANPAVRAALEEEGRRQALLAASRAGRRGLHAVHDPEASPPIRTPPTGVLHAVVARRDDEHRGS